MTGEVTALDVAECIGMLTEVLGSTDASTSDAFAALGIAEGEHATLMGVIRDYIDQMRGAVERAGEQLDRAEYVFWIDGFMTGLAAARRAHSEEEPDGS